MRWAPLLLLLASQAQATAIVVEVEHLEVSSTLEGSVRSLLEGGRWRGKRVPNPMSAQTVSDRILFWFAAPGAAIRGLRLEGCKDKPMKDLVTVSAIFIETGRLEILKSEPCGESTCYSLADTHAPVERLSIDFGLNPKPCLKRIELLPLSRKAGVVVRWPKGAPGQSASDTSLMKR